MALGLAQAALSALQNVWDQVFAAVVILTIGWAWGRWRSNMAWRRKQFKDRVLLALNMIEKKGDKIALKLRTLFEKDIHDVLQNTTMEKIVQKAINEVTENDPLVRLPKEDAWYILNAVLNRISEQFAPGLIRQDMGLPANSRWYTFCLTFEKEGGVRIQKLRIMIMKKDELLQFPDNLPLENFIVESEKHKGRVSTLRALKQELAKNPHLFMDIELSL